MPISTPHPSYSHYQPDWQKMRDFSAGSRAVKARGEAYLPKLTGQKDPEYAAYMARAEVYGATGRTIEGLVGAVFLKSPTVKLPSKADEELVADVTLAGDSLPEFLRAVTGEVVEVARCGVLVDYSGGSAPAGADDTRPKLSGADRPYLVSYSAEQIINWRTEVINGVTKLTLLVLKEVVLEPSAADPYVTCHVTQYRELSLKNGLYEVRVVREIEPEKKGEQPTYAEVAAAQPTRRGQRLTRIPFFFFGRSGQSVCPEKPPLLDMVELNHLHYMESADLAHGLHWVGLPTPWVIGCTDKDKLAIGPSTAIILEDKDATVGMLEFTGQGLKAITDDLAAKERKMAIMGARLLEEQKKEAEAAETVKLRQGGDASVLAGISDAVSRAAEALIAYMLWWNGTDASEPDVTIELNMDFMLGRLGHQDLVALLQVWQAGGISKESFLYNLKRGQILPEEITVDDELSKLDTEVPPGMQGGAGKGAAAGAGGGR